MNNKKCLKFISQYILWFRIFTIFWGWLIASLIFPSIFKRTFFHSYLRQYDWNQLRFSFFNWRTGRAKTSNYRWIQEFVVSSPELRVTGIYMNLYRDTGQGTLITGIFISFQSCFNRIWTYKTNYTSCTNIQTYFHVSDTWNTFHTEVIRIKNLLNNNNFPIKLIEK